MSRSLFPVQAGQLSRLSLMICLAFGATAPAHAVSTQWSTGQVSIEFDPDTFAFTSDTVYNGPMDISPSSVSYTQVDQGVVLNFNGLLSAYASSYQYFSPDSRTAYLNAFFDFKAEAGYAITGYTVTYTGGYFVESPGSVGLNAQSGTAYFNGDGGGGNFSATANHGGAIAPQIAGELGAWGGVDYIEVFDHYEQVYSHDEQVLDYCEQDDPTICHYRTEPVYIDQAFYRTESDLGEGQIFLNTISVQANVVAVPEASAIAMTLAGLGSLGWWASRRRRTAAA